MILFFKKNYLFFIALFGLFIFYNFYQILWLRPQSIHQWRQTDCLQIAHNYLTENWNFFSPSIHNYFSDGETSGKTAGEFPLLYYFVAILWKVFGEHEFIYRLVTLIIFSLGLYSLYDLLKRLLNNNFWALSVTFFLFTSPVLVFYSNNFLPNVPAFSFVLIGWNFFYRYHHAKKIKFLYFAIGMFTLGGLFKMTAYISFIILGAFYFFDLIKSLILKKEVKIFSNLKTSIFPFIFSLVILLSWYIYAAYFTGVHGGKYTYNGLWPIWKMEANQVELILNFIRDIIYHQLFSSTALWLIMAMGLFLFLDYKKTNRFIAASLSLLLIGCSGFIALWFQALEAHDYYVINLLLFPLFILVGFVWHLKENYSSVFNSKVVQILFSIFVVFNVFYASNNIKMRYWSELKVKQGVAKVLASKPEVDYWWWVGSHNSFEALDDIESYNRSIGIKKTDLVAFIPDQGFSTSLYLMNQKGWTSGFGIENDPNNSPEEKMKNKIDSKQLQYLFVGDSISLEKEYLKPFLHTPIGNYKGVLIFSLK